MKIRLKVDSRDKHSYQRFGSTATFEIPRDINFDNPNIAEKIQPIGNVQCGIFCADYLITNQFNKYIDFDELWNRVPHSMFGVSPNDLFKCILDYVIVDGQRFKPYNSFYRADTDPRFDAFDSTRSAQIQTNSPVIIFTNWYQNWLNLGKDAVMPIGKNTISGHLYVGKGWFNGENFIIEWWGGYTMTMPRAVFNDAVSKLGCGATVFSTVEQDEKRKKTVLEAIKDTCINLILVLKQLLVLKKVDNPLPTLTEPVTIKVMKNTLDNFCLAIRDFEGKPGDLNYINNNPGNLRSKSGPFLKFATMEEGMNALKNYVIRVRDGKHPAYPKDPTIKKFFSIYAPSSDNNSPLVYAKNVASKVGLTIDDTLSKLI